MHFCVTLCYFTSGLALPHCSLVNFALKKLSRGKHLGSHKGYYLGGTKFRNSDSNGVLGVRSCEWAQQVRSLGIVCRRESTPQHAGTMQSRKLNLEWTPSAGPCYWPS